MYLVLALANAAVALVSGISSLVGVARPRVALTNGEQLNSGVTFFARAYAARALPLSVVVLVMLATGSRSGLAPILIVSGLAQIGDAAIGATQRNWPMLATTLALAAVHLGSAHWLITH